MFQYSASLQNFLFSKNCLRVYFVFVKNLSIELIAFIDLKIFFVFFVF
jgi:hypothetical protein